MIWDVEPWQSLSQVGIVIIDGQIAYRRKAGESMLIIRNCNLINMAGIYEEKKDLVVENGKILDVLW